MRSMAFLLRCMATAASIAAIVPAHALPRYKVQGIGMLQGDDRSFAVDINNRGEAVGLSIGDAGGNAVIYRNGLLQSLNISHGGSYSVAIEINDRGQVAGSAPGPGDRNTSPYVYTDGRANFFIPDNGLDGEVYGLNNRGQAVGRLGDQAWYYDGSTVHTLRFADRLLQAVDINDSGLITGALLGTADHPLNQPFLYRDGQFTLLPSPLEHSQTAAMNNAGQVVGVSFDDKGAFQAVLWDNGQAQEITVPGASNASATDINEKGWVLGTFPTTAQGDVFHVFLHAGGVTRDLNLLLRPGDAAHWELNFAYGINDAGQIAGTGSFNGQTMGFVATPVPEPGAWALMLAGMGMTCVALRRRHGQERLQDRPQGVAA